MLFGYFVSGLRICKFNFFLWQPYDFTGENMDFQIRKAPQAFSRKSGQRKLAADAFSYEKLRMLGLDYCAIYRSSRIEISSKRIFRPLGGFGIFQESQNESSANQTYRKVMTTSKLNEVPGTFLL